MDIVQNLECGADANVPLLHGRTPLHYAAAQGEVATTSLLLRHGVNSLLRDLVGQLLMTLPNDMARRNWRTFSTHPNIRISLPPRTLRPFCSAMMRIALTRMRQRTTQLSPLQGLHDRNILWRMQNLKILCKESVLEKN
jgi:ankyrin repeat protein